MIYFEKGRNETIKYEVSYNSEEIKKLIDEIIDNCGAKKHITQESTLSPKELISNAKRRNIKIINLKRRKKTKQHLTVIQARIKKYMSIIIPVYNIPF